ncbi:hypothetical protein TgHK011_002709 [Trichoderma gracile]|nr:hypothetical protein TgHK011_002709 [Trichoderma gracile]
MSPPIDASSTRMTSFAMQWSPTRDTTERLPHRLREDLRHPASSQDTCHDGFEISLEPVKAARSLETLTTRKPRDAAFDEMNRLVQDLLASRKELEDERRKTADKDTEIAQLREEVAQLQQMDHKDCEEASELRRLLAFHIRNGEQLSRRFRDLQAVNKGLEAQLQAAETALEARDRYRSSLDRAPVQHE